MKLKSPLTLADVLGLNDLNRNSYTTLAHREGLAFMREDLLAERGHRKFRLAHSVAVACVLWTRQSTISIPVAVPYIEKEWRQVLDVTERLARGETVQRWFRFALWSEGEWEAETRDEAASMDAPEGRTWDDLRGVMYVPIHKIARDQMAALAATQEAA